MRQKFIYHEILSNNSKQMKKITQSMTIFELSKQKWAQRPMLMCRFHAKQALNVIIDRRHAVD